MAGKKAKKGKAVAGYVREGREVHVEPEFDQLPENERRGLALRMVGTADLLSGCAKRYRAAVGGYGGTPDLQAAKQELAKAADVLVQAEKDLTTN